MDTLLEMDYLKDLNDIKKNIAENQRKAMMVANSAMIMSYHYIGTKINERNVWGNKYIKKLSEDLKDIPGMSYRNLYYMKQFAGMMSQSEILQHPVAQIAWRTIIVLITKIKDKEKLIWYIDAIIKNNWNSDMLSFQIANNAYEYSLENKLMPKVSFNDDNEQEIFKDVYPLAFIDKRKVLNEKNLKEQMIDNIVSLIHEFGNGFAFVDKEYELSVGNEVFYVDLLFYNIQVHSYVVIEIKLGKLNYNAVGQLQFYVQAIDDDIGKNENPTYGLLLCSDGDKTVCETLIKSSRKNIYIAEYKLFDELPNYLEKRLHSK